MKSKILHLINKIPQLRIVVLGDSILDGYHVGEATKLNREAPVPVVRITSQVYAPGGAANLAVNYRNMGCDARFITLFGTDESGIRLHKLLQEKRIDGSCFIQNSGFITNTAQRVLAGNHMLVRYDTGNAKIIDPDMEWRVLEMLARQHESAQAMVISDYGKGLITDNIVNFITQLQKQRNIPLFVDAKDLRKYAPLHPVAVKPNFREVSELLNFTDDKLGMDRVLQIENAITPIIRMTNAEITAVTLDSDGAIIIKRDGTFYRTFADKVEHMDAVGAGDTFTALFSLSLLAGGDVAQSGEIAAAACRIVVGKKGTATCTPDELRDYFQKTNSKKICKLKELIITLQREREKGKSIVFTNGCFDILHSGHVTLLNKAKSFGSILVVGVNSDKSVRRLKGKERPINGLKERMSVLAGLSSVDYLIDFDNDTPEGLIQKFKPDVFVKGADYTVERLPEAKVVHSYGGVVKLVALQKDRSTTKIINEIKRKTAVFETFTYERNK